MPQPVNFGRVNLTFQQFNEIASGKYNAGEVRLAGETGLAKINNHVHLTFLNNASLPHAEVLAIKEAFVKALSQALPQDDGAARQATQDEINRVRQELGLAPRDATDLQMNARSVRPLSRQQIREIIDRNASAINAVRARASEGAIKTDADLHAGYGTGRRATIGRTRDETNRALEGKRATEVNADIGLVQDVISGDVDFKSVQARRSLLAAAKQQKADILARAHGNPSQNPDATFQYQQADSGLTVEFELGMSEAAYVDKLDDMILRLSSDRVPNDAVLAARREFEALGDPAARTAWLGAQANAPDGTFKVRTAAVQILHARGVDDYATLSLANRLSDADVRALLAGLLQLPENVRGQALRGNPAVAGFVPRAGAEAPGGERTFVPALSDLEFNRAIKGLVNGGGQEFPHRFKGTLEAVKAEVVAHFGAEALPEDHTVRHLSDNWAAVFGYGAGERDDVPAITPDVLRQRLTPDAFQAAARRFLDTRVASLLVAAGGKAHDATSVMNSCVKRNPALLGRLAAAQSPAEAQGIVEGEIDAMRALVRLHVVCEGERSAFVPRCREMLAREAGIPVSILSRDEAMFMKGEAAASQLAVRILSGEIAAGNDEEVRAAFGRLAEEHVSALAGALRQVEAMNLPSEAKDAVVDILLSANDVRIIDLGAIAEYARQVDLSAVTARLAANAPKEEVYKALDSILQKAHEATGTLLERRGVRMFGEPEFFSFGSILIAMAGGRAPDFVARVKAFAGRPDVQADGGLDGEAAAAAVERFMNLVAPDEEGAAPVPFRARMLAAPELAARFAPQGAAAQRALGMGYFRSELGALRRVAELYLAATGCTVDAAIDVALDLQSDARRLFSYGGRFIASADGFKAGLKLMKAFPGWYAATCAQTNQMRMFGGSPPANPSVTAINAAHKQLFSPNAERAFERFIFEEFSVNGALPLEAADPEDVFGMEANPATRFVGRGYITSAVNTLAQIPRERRSVLYAVVDMLSPLGADRDEVLANALDPINCEIISRVMRHYDEVARMKAEGRLTRAAFLTRFFPDIENAAGLTIQQLANYFVVKAYAVLNPNETEEGRIQLGPLLLSMQTSGATFPEALDAVRAGRPLPPAPFISDVNGKLVELDGTANGGRSTMLGDLKRPRMPYAPGGRPLLAEKDNVFKIVLPNEPVLRSMSGSETGDTSERNKEITKANTAIADKVAAFCGDVHLEQLGAVFFALSQAGAAPMVEGLLRHGINVNEHSPLTYALTKDAETGAITVRYSEPDGLPVHFHWETVIALDGTSTSTPFAVD